MRRQRRGGWSVAIIQSFAQTAPLQAKRVDTTDVAMMFARAFAFVASVAFVQGKRSNDVSLQVPGNATHVQANIRTGVEKCRGVNLGGWLVAEHWMTADAPFWQDVDSQFADSGEYAAITKAANLPRSCGAIM